MIQYIISDMDGTLFYQHGETVFDLSEENKEGIRKAKEHGVKLCVASGRMIDFGKRIVEQYQIEDCCAGFNGAVIYDHGNLASTFEISMAEIQTLMNHLENVRDDIQNIQFQSLDSLRYFDDLSSDYASKYVKDYAKTGIGEVANLTIYDAMKNQQKMLVGKISIIMKDPAKVSKLMVNLKNEFLGLTVVQSGEKLIEVVNGRVDKGTFCEYLLKTRGLTKDDIAVIGDAPNDLGMCGYSNHIFAMNSGTDAFKASAHYVVNNVGECINKVIELNMEEKRK